MLLSSGIKHCLHINRIVIAIAKGVDELIINYSLVKRIVKALMNKKKKTQKF